MARLQHLILRSSMRLTGDHSGSSMLGTVTRRLGSHAGNPMLRPRWILSVVCTILAGSSAYGCTSGHVGDPCIPQDEYSATFSGFSEAEANVESRSLQCETRVCIANHFRGRVSCPYGQAPDYVSTHAPDAANVDGTPDPGLCYVPGSDKEAVSVAIAPQLLDRRAQDTVYCSCRCDGPDKLAHYCSCPEGFSCLPLIPDLGFGQAQLVGSYCMKNGTQYDGTATGPSCSFAAGNCPSDRANEETRNPGP